MGFWPGVWVGWAFMVMSNGVSAQEIAPVGVDLGPPKLIDGRHWWKTADLEMDADEAVPVAAMEKLAVLAKSTAAALRAHALPLAAPPDGTTPRRKRASRDFIDRRRCGRMSFRTAP